MTDNKNDSPNKNDNKNDSPNKLIIVKKSR